MGVMPVKYWKNDTNIFNEYIQATKYNKYMY